MQEVLIDFIDKFGYIAIAVLICIENVFPPIPSEIVLLFGGFATTHTDMNVWLVILFSTIGSLVGALILYLLGYILNQAGFKKVLSGKFGKITRLKISDVEKAENWFQKYENKAVLFCRCIPVLRSLISIPAGMAKMKPLVFFSLTTIGSLVWNTILVWVGVLVGDAWEQSAEYIGLYSKVVIILLIIGGIGAVTVFYKKRKKSDKSNDEEIN